MLSFLLVPSNALLVTWSLLLGVFVLKPHVKSVHKLFALLSIFIAILIWTPLAQLVSAPLEYKFKQHPQKPAHKISYIVHLSGAERPNNATNPLSVPLNDQNARYFEVAKLADIYPDAMILFSGGNTSDTSSDLAIAMRIYTWLGLKDRAVFIGGAENTFGNAREVMKFLLAQGQMGQKYPVLLVTSAMHMPRSQLCFQALNIDVIAAPTEPLAARTLRLAEWITSPISTENLRTFDLAMHEWIGLLSYRIKGRINQLWPGQNKPSETET